MNVLYRVLVNINYYHIRETFKSDNSTDSSISFLTKLKTETTRKHKKVRPLFRYMIQMHLRGADLDSYPVESSKRLIKFKKLEWRS